MLPIQYLWPNAPAEKTLAAGNFEPWRQNETGMLKSEVLGLTLLVDGSLLRAQTPEGRTLPTLEETELDQAREAEARKLAEEEVERLRQELARNRLETTARVDMTDQIEPTDSPTQWVAEHTRRYVDTDGADGHIWRPPGWIGAGDWPQGVPTLLLTTIGRHSGKPRRTALIYGRDGERYLVVGSVGGADQHPAWYFNLQENPDVQLQVGAERFAARAYPATPEEKPRLWKLMAAIWPSFDRYQARTTRDIPLIVVERA